MDSVICGSASPRTATPSSEVRERVFSRAGWCDYTVTARCPTCLPIRRVLDDAASSFRMCRGSITSPSRPDPAMRKCEHTACPRGELAGLVSSEDILSWSACVYVRHCNAAFAQQVFPALRSPGPGCFGGFDIKVKTYKEVIYTGSGFSISKHRVLLSISN